MRTVACVPSDVIAAPFPACAAVDHADVSERSSTVPAEDSSHGRDAPLSSDSERNVAVPPLLPVLLTA
ncbi:Uncharacterised protein [Mycobacteroides abscessus]|nr:Uncharacterised protein [Mycobacteroides abscessus]